MANFNSQYQNTQKNWLIYIIGFIAIFSIIFVGGFYIAKPYLDNFIKKEMARHFINVETSEVSIIGKVNLTNIILPTPTGILLKIGAISARPPISFIPGIFTLYDIDLKYDNIHLQIPKMSINNVFLKGKDITIKSRILQSLMRLHIASIFAPDMFLFINSGNKSAEKINIKNFQIADFKNGRIRSIGIDSIITNIDLVSTAANDTQQIRLIAQSDEMKAYNINVNYAHSIIFGTSKTKKSKTVIGSIVLDNIMINILRGSKKNTSFSLGKFKTSCLKMKPMAHSLEQLIKAYINARKTNNHEDVKAVRKAALLNSFSAITSIDVTINKAAIDMPQLKTKLKSFELRPSQWQQSIPQKLLISLDGLSILSKKMEKKDLDFLKKMNFEDFNLSGKIDVSYNEEKRELLLNTISFNMKDIGSGSISAKIVNIDKAFFSGQKDTMIIASQDFSIPEIDMYYKDAGFIDKFFSYLAQNFGDHDHNLKEELYDYFYLIITKSLKMLLKDHDEAENISKSFGDFAKNPQTLKVKMRAKDNKGPTAVDLKNILQNDLSNILNKMSLTIKNEASF
ncbi:conserved protein of unknown function [Bartonella clarridgeiae 73]|uniref:Uncharacterized protein n=1 Tax=Bartonella clarridgeiae (strain CCUG 45776 / CIP 104772 / 73) TaxID=696125 RepID=E6YIP8_BARC7|nr:hypothetical protein [Bartonella clarridgeiae]CBI76736.1 conserved protein of unknown function [Bartonella clarridgeiae 73]